MRNRVSVYESHDLMNLKFLNSVETIITNNNYQLNGCYKVSHLSSFNLICQLILRKINCHILHYYNILASFVQINRTSAPFSRLSLLLWRLLGRECPTEHRTITRHVTGDRSRVRSRDRLVLLYLATTAILALFRTAIIRVQNKS